MNPTVFTATIAFLFFIVGCANSANVLVVNPYVSHSHFAFLVKLTDILADEGHNMTMVINELDLSQYAPLPKKAKVIIRSKYSLNPVLHGKIDQTFWDNGYEIFKVRNMFIQFMREMKSQCKRLLSDQAFADSFKTESFDIAMIEPTDYCGYGFLKMINVKEYVNIIPMALAEKMAYAMGLPGRNYDAFPSTVAHDPQASYFERVFNYLYPVLQVIVHDTDKYGMSGSVVRELVDPTFNMEEAVAHARFTFLNTEEHMDYPRPISHKIVYIGGITVANSSADDLPNDYKKIFTSSKKGVVLVSFGSVAKSSTMPSHIRQSFLDMFAAFPEISFIWKFENESDTVANDLPNVFKKTWVPQPLVLAHPKLLAFVTHGGMNSVMEGGHAGIPLLGIPLFGDQHRNIKMLEYRRSAILVEKNHITSETLIASMHKLTDDDSYRTRARTIAALARRKPLAGKQRFVTYFNHAVEFVHVDDFLDIGHRKLDVFRYYNLDIWATIGAVGVVIVYVLFKTVAFIVNVLGLNFLKFTTNQKKNN